MLLDLIADHNVISDLILFTFLSGSYRTALGREKVWSIELYCLRYPQLGLCHVNQTLPFWNVDTKAGTRGMYFALSVHVLCN
jgi:hypothetical protein